MRGLKRYGRLLRYLRPYWRGRALIVAVTLLSIGFGLLQPWPMKILLDNVLGGQPLPETLARILALLPGTATPEGLLPWVALAGLGVFAANSAVDVILTVAWIKVGQGMVYDLSRDLFAYIQRRSLLYHTRTPIGESMSRIAGDSWVIQGVVDTLLFRPLYAVVTLAMMLVVMVRLDLHFTLLSLVVAPFMAASSWLFGRPIRRAADAGRALQGRRQSLVQQTLSGIAVVQAFGQEARHQRQFLELADDAIRTQRRNTLTGSLHGLTSGLITKLGAGTILWLGGRQVLEGHLTAGSILVFLSYLGTLQAQISSLAGIYTTLQGVGAGVDRVLEVLGAEREVEDRPGAYPLPPVQGHLRLEGVTFGYAPGSPVLHDVWLEARPGQTVAIVGPTGAGKSTLLSLVPRFFDPWQGRVRLDGHDLREVQVRSLRAQLSLVLQEPFLFPLTIAENIAYGRPEATRAQVEAAARAANAHGFISRLLDGYDTVVGERGATLSGGERQRLAIARALLKDAPILLLDEPTSALDAETEGLLLEALARLMVGRTTLIIAHRLSTIRAADCIVALQEGRVVEQGTHAELLARDGLYARFHRLQFGERGEPAGVTTGVAGVVGVARGGRSRRGRWTARWAWCGSACGRCRTPCGGGGASWPCWPRWPWAPG
jgi:ATP-binding cassette subfamily B protein/subfamily B ATP-binding cassette protein MsbA